MSAFSRLSPETQAALRREAPGVVLRVPLGYGDVELEARNVRIRDQHRAHVEVGLSSRQSVRLLMLEWGLSRAGVFNVLRKIV